MSNTPSNPTHDLTLPEGYGVVELSTGRFCPVWVDADLSIPLVTLLCWEGQQIPFARGLHHSGGVVCFASRREAVQYCQCKAEEWSVLYACDQLAAGSELYPERNAYSQEEIVAVTGGVVTIFSEDGQAVADVRLQDGTFQQAREATIELALQRLCERVSTHLGIDWWQARPVLSTGV